METQECLRSHFATLGFGDVGMIVVVEDPFIRAYLRTALARQGYGVVGADPISAARMLRSGETPVALLITNSPSDFLEFAGTTPLLYLSGSPNPDLVAPFSSCRTLQKPFHPDDLIRAVKELTGKPV